MNGQASALRVTDARSNNQICGSPRWRALIPGSFLLLGFWGTVTAQLGLGQPWIFFVCGVLCLTVALAVRWEKLWHGCTALGALLALCLLCVLFREPLGRSAAGLWQCVGTWYLRRTGIYSPGYADAADPTAALMLCAGGSGLCAGWSLRKTAPVQGFLSVALLLLLTVILESFDWWMGLFLVGTLLWFAQYAGGSWKKMLFATLSVLLVCSLTVGALTGADISGGLKKQAEKLCHRLLWEKAENPLPEGDLNDLGAFRPTDGSALDITMENWTVLYLRGFTAGNYTGSGWERTDGEALIEAADSLYALQENCFFPATQLGAAMEAVQSTPENSIHVQSVGACGQTAYVPYGVSGLETGVLRSADLIGEGQRTSTAQAYSAELFDVCNAYLLQEQVAESTDSYREQETFYRQWVYEQYLSVPEAVRTLLSTKIDTAGLTTTVQATREITRYLQENITYNELAVTLSGTQDFATYVLNVSRCGYSVHYATLATLMLRCCGIPARYVEGYTVTPTQAESMAEGETLHLTQKNAHAWAEYYLDGVGWIPFDPTPGYSDNLKYALPESGLPTQQEGNRADTTPPTQEQTPEQTPEVQPEPPLSGRFVYLRQAVLAVFLLLIVLLALLAGRTLLLRKKLQRKLQSFSQIEPRKACAGVVCHIRLLSGTAGKDQMPSVLAWQISLFLKEEIPAQEIETLIQQVWFSSHPVTEEQRLRALQWMDEAQSAWEQTTGWMTKLKMRFWTCQIR